GSGRGGVAGGVPGGAGGDARPGVRPPRWSPASTLARPARTTCAPPKGCRVCTPFSPYQGCHLPLRPRPRGPHSGAVDRCRGNGSNFGLVRSICPRARGRLREITHSTKVGSHRLIGDAER